MRTTRTRSWSRRCAQATRQAFARLVDELNPALIRLALAHVPSRAIAEDVVQDTWLGVINGIDRFEGRSALRTWIFQILLNNARTKRQAREAHAPVRLASGAAARRAATSPRSTPTASRAGAPTSPGHWARPPVEWGSPEQRLAADETRDVLLEAVAALPPRQREVLALRDIQGYSADEARNALGLSETNQRVLLHRGRSKVRAALERHFEQEVGTMTTKS